MATVIYLCRQLGRPIFLEGEPGVGKTEVAIVLSKALKTRMIRLQCHEGLDAGSALYEWDYPRQLIRIKLESECRKSPENIAGIIYSQDYLIKRPLLDAISGHDDKAPVLLIDEVDRADEEFEAFLLEILADFQVTIPELGTIRAEKKPFVVVTSNRTRDIHDALKRRCLYHWIDYPSYERELAILRAKFPGIEADLASQVVRFMQWVRRQDLIKIPGISETLDWANALIRLNQNTIDKAIVDDTMGCILKVKEDLQRFKQQDMIAAFTRSEGDD